MTKEAFGLARQNTICHRERSQTPVKLFETTKMNNRALITCNAQLQVRAEISTKFLHGLRGPQGEAMHVRPSLTAINENKPSDKINSQVRTQDLISLNTT